MPRYYFRVEPDGPIDAEGENLPDDAAATELAVLIVEEMTKKHPGWVPRRLCVYDRTGRLAAAREMEANARPPAAPYLVK